MRRSLPLALLLALVAPTAAHGETPAPSPPEADRMQDKRAKLEVTIDRSRVDLAGHKLEVKLSRAAEKVRLKIIGASGAVLAEVEKAFNGAAAGTVLEVGWTPSSDEEVGKIEVWGHDTEGYYAGVAITPWSFKLPHDELNFETDSDVIRPSEVPKLEASLQKVTEVLAKHAEFGKITLFVAGHTDTVGSADHNMQLSRKRARACAAWFRAHGLKSPVVYEGFGQRVLLVKTADQVDEPRNRRIDFILALDPPGLPADLSWKAP